MGSTVTSAHISEDYRYDKGEEGDHVMKEEGEEGEGRRTIKSMNRSQIFSN